MAWNTALVQSAATVTWSDGTPFDGYVLLSVVPPSGYSQQGKSSFFPIQKLPGAIKVPIRNGVINNTTKIPWTNAYDPPGCAYLATWYDPFDNVISGPIGPFTVTADPYTVSVPTLTTPVGGGGGGGGGGTGPGTTSLMVKVGNQWLPVVIMTNTGDVPATPNAVIDNSDLKDLFPKS